MRLMSTMTEQEMMAAVEHVGADLGAAAGAAMALLGDRLGLWRALADGGPLTPVELASRTGCAERYVREWLASQAAGGWLSYEPETGRFTLDPAYAAVVAADDSPVFLGGSMQMVGAMFASLDRLGEAFRSGEGIGWGEHHGDLHHGVARFFRVACEPYLGEWIAALDGVDERLQAGGRVLDVGCGEGSAALALALRYPRASVTAVDAHAPSIEIARDNARRAGVEDRVTFIAGDASDLPADAFDLVCALDVLHDLGDPVGVATAVRRALTSNGAWLIVEPFAGDRLEENLNPVGRMYYAGSTAFCMPCALKQDGGWALGNQAGPSRLREIITRGGFATVEEVARTPWQLVLGAR
jgi:SAM-dependent methyltransferase